MEIMTALSLAVTLYQIANGEITKYKQLKKDNADRISALHKEVRDNLDIVEHLLKMDTGFQAVYDRVVRKLIGDLSFKELETMSKEFEPILGKPLKKVFKKSPSAKDPVRIFWNIKDTATKLKALKQRMKLIPSKKVNNAPKIFLSQRLPALKWRLSDIEIMLKKVSVK